MSGGHWDYQQYNTCEFLNDIAVDTYKRFPKLSQIHEDFSTLFAEVWHDLDWDFSGDSEIEDDEEFEKVFVEKLGKIIRKKFTLKIYDVEEN